MIAMSILLFSVADFLKSHDLEVFVRSHQDFIILTLDPHKDEFILAHIRLQKGLDLLQEVELSW